MKGLLIIAVASATIAVATPVGGFVRDTLGEVAHRIQVAK